MQFCAHMQKRLLFIVFLGLIAFSGYGQYGRPQITGTLGIAIPVNEFSKADPGDQAYFGMGVDLSFPILKDTPLRLGLDFRYFWMGNRDRNVDIIDTMGVFQYNLNSKVSGGMMPIHLRARIDFMNIYNYPVLPYAGGFYGLKVFSIARTFEFDYEDGTEPFDESERSTSTTVSYGFELGLHIRVTSHLLIDVRYERAFGGRANYLDVSSIEIDDEGFVSYDQLNTRTDVDMFTVGAILELD